MARQQAGRQGSKRGPRGCEAGRGNTSGGKRWAAAARSADRPGFDRRKLSTADPPNPQPHTPHRVLPQLLPIPARPRQPRQQHATALPHLELGDGLGEAKDFVGDLLGGGLARAVVELDAPVLLCTQAAAAAAAAVRQPCESGEAAARQPSSEMGDGNGNSCGVLHRPHSSRSPWPAAPAPSGRQRTRAAGVVGGRHDEAPVQLAAADERAHGGGGHDGILAHHHLAHAVAGRDAQDDLRAWRARGRARREQVVQLGQRRRPHPQLALCCAVASANACLLLPAPPVQPPAALNKIPLQDQAWQLACTASLLK